MQYKIRETITDNGRIISQNEFTYENETDMENGIAELRVAFNKSRLSATLNGKGIQFLNRKQTISIL